MIRSGYNQLFPVIALTAGVLSAGCAMVPQNQLARCQEVNRSLTARLRSTMAEKHDLDRHARELAEETRMSEDELLSLRDQLNGLRNQWDPNNPLPSETSNRLADLARRYPESFEFDPATGISKLNSDILFSTGKDELRTEVRSLLGEFANIVNEREVYDYNIMIVGHTDDRPIARTATREKHPTNWHLSAHRAISVQDFLQDSGVRASRMGVAGYGEHQPVEANSTNGSRQRNRRVEIYVLAPDAAVAGRSLDRAQAANPLPDTNVAMDDRLNR
jgi:chemotaxis protein MotB|tara:strand:+ start:1798 stop:2622 length:825 start_codon:yes stop_codon:yes gene_type:complete